MITVTLKLSVPDGRKKPDEFYEQVAARWTVLTVWQRSHRPASELAEANGVPTSTVHGWVKEARRRGILGPGQRGPGKPCPACGQVMDEKAIAFEQRRRAHWQ